MDTKKILDKVAKLIALAEHENTEPVEAATFRAKAEGLMREYRIEEEQLIAVDQFSILPIRSDLLLCFASSMFLQRYVDLSYYAAKHAGVRVTWLYRTEGNRQALFAAFVGYEGDVRLAEYLFSSASLVFGERIDPTVNAALSDVENIYRLRSAGITRRDVAKMLWDIDTHAAHSKVAKIYKEESERRGERPALNGRGISALQYRVAYSEEFCWTFSDRLRVARSAADSTGGALVLSGRSERIDEAFYVEFPHLRPKPRNKAEAAVEKTEAEKKAAARREAALQRKLDRGPTQAERAAEARRYSAAAMAGRNAGERAARAVDLGRGQAPRAGRIDEAPERVKSAIEG